LAEKLNKLHLDYKAKNFFELSIMGCFSSKQGNSGTRDTKGTVTRAPILLFYVPGTHRTEIVSKFLARGLNIRFVDFPNQRLVRRNWVQELSSRWNYVTTFYISDIRDRRVFY
jgi:hypothetical protein